MLLRLALHLLQHLIWTNRSRRHKMLPGIQDFPNTCRIFRQYLSCTPRTRELLFHPLMAFLAHSSQSAEVYKGIGFYLGYFGVRMDAPYSVLCFFRNI